MGVHIDDGVGWLAPDGTFHACRYGGHTYTARQIAPDYGVDLSEVDPLSHWRTFEAMRDAGFAYITTVRLDDERKHEVFRPSDGYTDAQIAYLQEFKQRWTASHLHIPRSETSP